jgi:Spy/CpxP family protein refolding chaperone
MNGKSKSLALTLLLVVLLLGGVAGAAVERLVVRRDEACRAEDRRPHGDRRESYLDWLSSELALTPEQRAQVEATVERHRQAVSALWREVRPRFEEMKAQLREEIRSTLDDEQRATYEELLKRESERRHRGRRGR